MRVEYREEPCRNALNRVRGMPFAWSLNPYMGCVHQCTFCYVRAFEARADRPWDERYGASIRVKTNVAEVLRRELARASWERETVAIGAATDPYQPAEGRYRLTRACLEVLAEAWNPFAIITRGPLIVRDIDVLAEAASRAEVSVTFSVPTLDHEIWRRTEPGTAPPRQRLRALARLVEAGIKASVGMAPILPGLSDKPELLAEVVREARAAGATGIWARTSCISAQARASTSLRPSSGTGPSCCRSTKTSTAAAPIYRAARPIRCRNACARSPASTASETAAGFASVRKDRQNSSRSLCDRWPRFYDRFRSWLDLKSQSSSSTTMR